MIVSHKHQFIYLKTIKTASSSMENLLCSVCGPDDIVTPTAPRFMELRPGKLAQNYRISHPDVPKRPFLKRLLGRPERYHHPSVGYYEHMPAWRVKTYLGDEIWNSYYKFTFERNPWDRQVSFFHFRSKDKNRSYDFESFLSNKERALVDNWGIYTINDEIAVDFLGKYENLEEDFAKAMKDIGLPSDFKLPTVNKSSKPKKEFAYRDYYTDKTRELIRNWHASEIDYLGYTF